MFYALVFYPELNSELVTGLRKKYDPYYNLIREHITLVFPVPESVGEEKLHNHIENVLDGYQPFKVHITGYEKSWDNWLFLKVREGKDKLIQLHDNLYKGILELYLREDIPYKPHIGLGLFSTETYDPLHPEKLPLDEKGYQDAVEQMEKFKPDFWRIMNQLSLVKISKDFSQLWEEKTYYLT